MCLPVVPAAVLLHVILEQAHQLHSHTATADIYAWQNVFLPFVPIQRPKLFVVWPTRSCELSWKGAGGVAGGHAAGKAAGSVARRPAILQLAGHMSNFDLDILLQPTKNTELPAFGEARGRAAVRPGCRQGGQPGC